jgi:NAD(P)-dependent dehydrogenase (short-subunit alcohol dehydrogenase family)
MSDRASGGGPGRGDRDDRQRVVVVTGGGGGIGAAVAEQLGREGAFVVTMDPLVSLDGSEQLPDAEETTAGRIVAAGGSARASSVSVTDGAEVRNLFEGLVDEFGRLDAVVNVAGITRPTSFTRGSEDDWLAVLGVHLDGYLNILGAALPIMAAAGHGRILGVTSGSGWRPADTGAYGCAKRAVAALTWQLGRDAPPGVVVNAMSPIAVTRMVTAALGRVQVKGGSASGSSATGGLSLGSMPLPEQLGPSGAHLVGDAFAWCSGQVIFVGGSEVAVIQEPRLLEVVRSDGVTALDKLLEAVTAGALAPAEVRQASNGGSNPRFGPAFDESVDGDLPPSVIGSCAVVTDRPEVQAAVAAALDAREVRCRTIEVGDHTIGFDGAAGALAASVERDGPLDAVVVALRGAGPAPGSGSEWERVLAEHAGLVGYVHADAAWARAVADHVMGADRPVRVVTLTDGTTTGGRSRGQASAQLARSAQGATGDRVAAFVVSIETPEARDMAAIGELAAHLLCSPESASLSGAELVAGTGWFGLRSHPHPSGSITFGGPDVPEWIDDALRRIVGTGVLRVGDDREMSRGKEDR